MQVITRLSGVVQYDWSIPIAKPARATTACHGLHLLNVGDDLGAELGGLVKMVDEDRHDGHDVQGQAGIMGGVKHQPRGKQCYPKQTVLADNPKRLCLKPCDFK